MLLSPKSYHIEQDFLYLKLLRLYSHLFEVYMHLQNNLLQHSNLFLIHLNLLFHQDNELKYLHKSHVQYHLLIHKLNIDLYIYLLTLSNLLAFLSLQDFQLILTVEQSLDYKNHLYLLMMNQFYQTNQV